MNHILVITLPASSASEGVSGCWNKYKRNSAIGISSVCFEGGAFYSVHVSTEGLVALVGNTGLREILGNLDNYISHVAQHLSQLDPPGISSILFYMPCQLRNVNEN
jgi:hypothetical protein